ncbi:hypothetical protein [Rhodococcus sp. NPDC004095]
MSSDITIAKLKTIADISQSFETKQLCNVMIEYIEANEPESKEFGFKGGEEVEVES